MQLKWSLQSEFWTNAFHSIGKFNWQACILVTLDLKWIPIRFKAFKPWKITHAFTHTRYTVQYSIWIIDYIWVNPLSMYFNECRVHANTKFQWSPHDVSINTNLSTIFISNWIAISNEKKKKKKIKKTIR